MKIYLATFYSSDLKRSANRFKQQAEEMKVYDKIFVYNQDDLNQDFKDYIHMLLKKGKERGYGHWVWQTYIHQLVLSQIDYGDIYHWCDVGCHFNQKGIWRLKEYIDLVELKIIETPTKVIHIHEPELFSLASKIKKMLGAKIIYDVHEDYISMIYKRFELN